MSRGLTVIAFLTFAGVGLWLGWSMWFVVIAFIVAVVVAIG